MRRLIIGMALLAVWAVPSYAQRKPDNALNPEERVVKSNADAVDRQYRATIERTRKASSETKADPWSNMRGTDTSKSKR